MLIVTDIKDFNDRLIGLFVLNNLDGNICGNCDEEGLGLRKVCQVG